WWGGSDEAGAVSGGRAERAGPRHPDRSRGRRHLRRGGEKLYAAADDAGPDRRFRPAAPGPRTAGGERRSAAARQRAAASAIAASRQNPVLHRQLLGACATRGAPPQHVSEEPGGGGRAWRHDRIAGIRRAVDLYARGQTSAGDERAGEKGRPARLAERRLRLY